MAAYARALCLHRIAGYGMPNSNKQNDLSSGWIPTRATAAGLSLKYALLGSLWILLSGWLLHHLVKDTNLAASLETVKGWFFVTVTAFLLYLALDRYFREIRKSAQLLQDSERRWQFALESAGHGVWDWNPQTDKVFFSVSWKSMLGFEPHEIENTLDEWKSRVHPEDLPRVLNEIEQHFAGKTPVYVSEHRLRCKDGNYIWILDQGKIMSRTRDGKPLRVLGTHLDITERKLADQALRESEGKWRSYIENAPVGVLVADATGRLLEVNKAAEEMLGYEPGGLLNIRIMDLPAEEMTDAASQYLAKVTQKGQADGQFLLRRKDGSRIWAFSRASKIPGERFMAILQDITELKRNEQEKAELESHLQRAQKMESIGRLAGGVAHDFNNMLGAILGYVEFALEQVDCKHPVYADLEEIRKAAKRSADLTQQLLAFARKQEVAPKVLDVNNTIAGVLKMLHRLIGEHIELEWSPGAEVWSIEMDPSQIDQILTNLLVNARDAIVDIGRIIIRTENHTLDEQYCACHPGFLPGEYVALAVSDNGRGMDEETQKQIFEPFFTTKGIGKGTGLGLATIYGIVKQNGGFIYVDSVLGQGTTFKIYLPRYLGNPVGTYGNGKSNPEMRGQETVLLVEDEPSLLKMTTRMLQQQGYIVLAAPSPMEAMRIAREHTRGIQILVTDLVMPEMNGRDLAKTMLTFYPHIKRLFISGYSAIGDASDPISPQTKLEPDAHFLHKPFSMRELAAAVRRSLDSN
jgi:PAS domain S-box-containing protein